MRNLITKIESLISTENKEKINNLHYLHSIIQKDIIIPFSIYLKKYKHTDLIDNSDLLMLYNQVSSYLIENKKITQKIPNFDIKKPDTINHFVNSKPLYIQNNSITILLYGTSMEQQNPSLSYYLNIDKKSNLIFSTDIFSEHFSYRLNFYHDLHQKLDLTIEEKYLEHSRIKYKNNLLLDHTKNQDKSIFINYIFYRDNQEVGNIEEDRITPQVYDFIVENIDSSSNYNDIVDEINLNYDCYLNNIEVSFLNHFKKFCTYLNNDLKTKYT